MPKPTPAHTPAWLHVTVWGVAALLDVWIVLRAGRVLALDHEALVANLAEGFPARIDATALALDGALLRFGALPLGWVVLASLLYRLSGLRSGRRNPLAGWGIGARALLLVALFVPFALACAPAADALAVWAQVEALWWIQWADHVPFAMDRVRLETPAWWHAGLLAGGLLAGVAALRDRPGRRARRGLRLAWTGARVLFVLAALALAAPTAALFALHGGRVATAPGLGEFERTCGQCHLRSRPLFFVKTPVEWQVTVTRMRAFEGAPIDEDGAARVAEFVGGMRGFADRWTFRTRCQRCHVAPSRGWEPRAEQDWRAITERIARWSPYYYRPQVRDQVVAHLVHAHGDEGATLGLAADALADYRTLSATCGACHSVTRDADRVGALDAASRAALLRRMNDKRVTPWDADELARYGARYDELIADPTLRARVFAHDLPVLEGGIAW